MARHLNPLERFVVEHPRAYGLILTLAGVGMMIWTVVLPIRDAIANASEVWISRTGIAVGESLLLFGIPAMIFGSRFVSLLPLSKEDPRPPEFYVSVAIMVVIAIVTYYGLKTFLESKGYFFQ
jgi:hypothetical protein